MVYLFADVSKKVILISLNIEVPFETRPQISEMGLDKSEE